MNKLFIFILAGLIIIDISTACFTKTEPTVVQINVVSGNTAATGIVTVSLYSSMTDLNNNLPTYVQNTDGSNGVNITVDYLSQYYVLATRGTAKNYYAGFIPVGIFQSQTDINNSPAQSPAGVVGGVKFKDINGDRVINNSDKTDAPVIVLSEGKTNYQSVIVY